MPSPYPLAPRVFAAGGAVGMAALFGVMQPASFAAAGCDVASWVALAATIPIVVLFTLLALAPALAQRLLARTKVDLRDGGHAGAVVLLAATLFFVLGWGGLITATATVEAALTGCALPATGDVQGADVLIGVTLNFALFTIPVLLYVSFVHGHGPRGALGALGLKRDGAPRAFAIGVATAFGFLVVLAIATAALEPTLPQEVLENDTALRIAKSLTVGGAIALAVASGLGEEIFFRGFLQPRLGNLLTSTVFALPHFGYGSVSEVVVVFALSLCLGALYRWTRNLWAPVAAHFAFNLLNLLIGMYAPTPA